LGHHPCKVTWKFIFGQDILWENYRILNILDLDGGLQVLTGIFSTFLYSISLFFGFINFQVCISSVIIEYICTEYQWMGCERETCFEANVFLYLNFTTTKSSWTDLGFKWRLPATRTARILSGNSVVFIM
jgi:hypothetical protein